MTQAQCVVAHYQICGRFATAHVPDIHVTICKPVPCICLVCSGFKGAINLNLTGSGGQSFGVFLAGGINVKLTGEANDYVGKGMAGGEIVIVPPADAGFAAESASIVGNTCLYGATGA